MRNEPGADEKQPEELVSVFSDVRGHMAVAEIIRDHLADKEDVREVALNRIETGNTRSVLDLGCGYGFFTRALKGRLHPEATVTGIDMYGQYRDPYLDACHESGLNCTFIAEGADILREMADNIFGLVICSYALYFFPGSIRYVARVLERDGHFVAVTHSRPHMIELTMLVRNILEEQFGKTGGILPYGKLISNFSNENGRDMLSEWFESVEQLEYKNTLIFTEEDYDDFEKYFFFKSSFFLPEGRDNRHLTALVLEKIRERMKEGPLRITKDDMIFICTEPRKVL